MDLKQFKRAAALSQELAKRWFDPVVTAMKEFGITAVADQAMFIAQIGHESAGFECLVENLNYTPQGLINTFGQRISRQQALALGRGVNQPAKQQAIANLVYYQRNGNQTAADGWKYRGRGLIQITGLENYRECGAALKLDLVRGPEQLESDNNAARSAAWFYTNKGCMLYSDDIERVTLIINGGRKGLADRRIRYNTAKATLL